MELHQEIKTVKAESRKDRREWLAQNHQSEKSVWLIIFHKRSNNKSIYYDEAVEEDICFGWIDSIAHKRDHESKYQFFAHRKPKSNWSKSNRERAENMLELGRMTPNGQKLIDLAKTTGTWEALIDVQNSIIPADLKFHLNQNQLALKNFQAFSPSSKRIILELILNAKKNETRQKRIEETVRLAAENIKANHYRQ